MSLLAFILQLVISFILFLILFLSVGLKITNLLKLDKKITSLGNALMATFLAFSAYASVFYFLGQYIGPKIYFLNYLFLILGLLNSKELINYLVLAKKFVFKNKLLSLFTVFCILSFYLTVAFSGLYNSTGDLVFQPGQLHDSIWHVALIKNIKENIPPIHPASFNYELHNYHYFYDLILASFSYSFGLNIFLIYFQVFSLILSSLLALSALYLAESFQKRNMGYWLLFFTFFVGSFAQFIPYFVPNQAWNDGSFWVSQTFTMMVNPQLIYSLALVYFVVALMQVLSKFKKVNLIFLLIISFLIAASIGFKSYGFVVMSVLYASFLFLNFLIKRNKIYLISLILFSILASLFFVLTNDIGQSVFFYQPFWYTTSMIESPDRVNYPLWKILEQHYIQHKNWARVYEIWLKEFLIFFFGNLGTRSLAVFLPLIYLLKRKWPSVLEFSIFFSFIFSSFFPLFFLQRGIVWNSIQFWYYALILANIFVWLFFCQIFKKFKNKLAIILIMFLLLILSLPTYLKTLENKFKRSDKISAAEISFLNTLSKNDKVLICPTDGLLFKTSSIEALTDASVYFANPVQLLLVGVPAEEQELELKEIFTMNKFGEIEKIIQANDINYVACEKKAWLKIIENNSLEINTLVDWQIRKIK